MFSSFIPHCPLGGCFAGQSGRWDCIHWWKMDKRRVRVQNHSRKPSQQKIKRPRIGFERERETNINAVRRQCWQVLVAVVRRSSSPSSAVARRSRCSRESEGSAWAGTAKPAWRCSRGGTASQADPSAWPWDTLNLGDLLPKNTIHKKTTFEEFNYTYSKPKQFQFSQRRKTTITKVFLTFKESEKQKRLETWNNT